MEHTQEDGGPPLFSGSPRWNQALRLSHCCWWGHGHVRRPFCKATDARHRAPEGQLQ